MDRKLSSQQVRLLSELQLEVQVELAALPISAAELLQLEVGQRIACDFSPDKLLSLRVGQEVIARARLVVEGEALMLEIVEA